MKLYILITGVCILAVAQNGAGAEVTWLGNYTAALHEAQTTGKPLLLSFRCVP